MKKLAKFLLTTAATLVAAATVKAATVVGPISTVFYKDEGVTVSTSPNTIDFVGSGVTVTKTGVSSMTVTITGGGGGGASSLEVFNNNDATRSSPTASIGLSNAFRGTVSGSTYTFRINFSSVASVSSLDDYLTKSSATATYLQVETGDISAVTAGSGLTGGGTSGAVTLHLDPNATHYIHNQSSLQSGATFYVSSGTIFGPLTVSDNGGGASLLNLYGPLIVDRPDLGTGLVSRAAMSFNPNSSSALLILQPYYPAAPTVGIVFLDSNGDVFSSLSGIPSGARSFSIRLSSGSGLSEKVRYSISGNTNDHDFRKADENLLINFSSNTGIGIYDSDSSNFISFKSSSVIAYNQKYVLFETTGTVDQVAAIKSLNADGSVSLYWKTDANSGGGGGSSIYGATATASFPFGFSASTAVFSSSMTLSGGYLVQNVAPNSGQVLKFDGTNWAPGTDNNSGGGGGTTMWIQEGGSTVVQTSTLTFNSDQFTITDLSGKASVVIDTMTAGGIMALSTGTNAAGQLLRLDGNADVLDANLSANVSLFGSQIDISAETNATASNGVVRTDDDFSINWSSAISRSDVSAAYQPLDATLTDLAAAPLGEDNSISVGAIAAGSLPSDVIASSVAVSAFFSDATVRSNLGLAIGTNVQAYDADLDDLADGSLTGSKVGSGVPAANIASGSLGASVIASSISVSGFFSDATVRSNLGLAIGTNVQAWDTDLDDLADGSLTGSKVGSGVPAANIASGALGASVLASSLTATGATPGTYGSATQVSSFTVDAQGRVSGAANVAISISTTNLNATGTASATTFLRGDNTWATPAGGGGGSSTLAVGTGTATNFTNNVTSPTAAISFHGDYFRATTNGTTSFITLAPKFSQTYTPLQIVTSSGTLGIQNSTTTRPMALYDASAHEWADWQSLQLKPYSGGALSADIAFTMASATSGGVTWSVQLECIASGASADYDTASFDTFNSTSGATVPATAGYLKVVTVPLTNNDSCASGDSFRPRLNRLPADSGDTASGDAEFRWMRIYE